MLRGQEYVEVVSQPSNALRLTEILRPGRGSDWILDYGCTTAAFLFAIEIWSSVVVAAAAWETTAMDAAVAPPLTTGDYTFAITALACAMGLLRPIGHRKRWWRVQAPGSQD